MTITLPLPPSGNRYWRHVGNKVLLSADARAYRQAVALKCMCAGFKPLDGPVSLHVRVYRARKAGDLMNFEKQLSDALQGFAFRNDSQIHEAHFYLDYDKGNPRVAVRVEEIGGSG